MPQKPTSIDFTGKVALITGASSGLGEGIAIYFARLGCAVALTGRNEENLRKNKMLCIDAGLSENRTFYMVGDITDVDFQRQLIESTCAKLGKIDYLINNAGVATPAALDQRHSVVMKTFIDVLNINLLAPVSMCEMAWPYMNRHGCVVNISSIASQQLGLAMAGYGTSKAALDYFTKQFALRMGVHDKKIRAVTINPSAVITPIFGRATGWSDKEIREHVEPTLAKAHALGRCGKVDEIAYACAFLCSEQASWITGINMPIDGGALLTSKILIGTDLNMPPIRIHEL